MEAGIFPEALERNFPTRLRRNSSPYGGAAPWWWGAGGLGGCQAMVLARGWVGRLYLADGDAFTPSNLNRQLLATTLTLGQSKAVVSARHLREVNAGLLVEALPEFLDQERLREDPARDAGAAGRPGYH